MNADSLNVLEHFFSHVEASGQAYFVLLLFVSFLLLAVIFTAISLIRSKRSLEMLYAKFPNYIGEFILVLSKNMDVLNLRPQFAEGPFFDELLQGRTLKEILDAKDWNLIKMNLEQFSKNPEREIVFPYRSGDDRVEWFELRSVLRRVYIDDFQYVCFIKNITKEVELQKKLRNLQDNLDSVLKNTGDFLWKVDVEKRQFSFVTPLMDDDFHSIPQTVGRRDLYSIMPAEDSTLFEKAINERILNYHKFGKKGDPYASIKVRFRGSGNSWNWYALRGTICMDEDERLVFSGTARRLEFAYDYDADKSGANGSIYSALFPDARAFVVDRDFRFVSCNMQFALDNQLVDPEEIRGREIEEIVDNRLAQIYRRNLTNLFTYGKQISEKGCIKSPYDDQMKYYEFDVAPLAMEKGAVVQVICVQIIYDKSDFEKRE
ncbi:MAG: PAS domain-containing protein [Fibrobacteraceae bacterium]|nr:PAS domain-containing protein [Fibrobacteraceae bacterium]